MSAAVAHRPVRGSLRLLLSLVVGILSGCGPATDEHLPEGCFATNPREQQWQESIDYAEAPGPKDVFELLRLQSEIGFCEYGPGEYPEAFDEYNPSRVERVAACFEAQAGDSCAACPERDIEAEILGAYAAKQDQAMCPVDSESREIHELELGCVARLQIEGEWQCCYNAAVVGECDTEPGHD